MQFTMLAYVQSNNPSVTVTQAQLDGLKSGVLEQSVTNYGALDLVRQSALMDMAFVLVRGIANYRDMVAGVEASDWTAASTGMLETNHTPHFVTQHAYTARANLDAQMLLTGNPPDGWTL